MTLEIDEEYLAAHLDGIKKLADSNNSQYNAYPRMYHDYLKAYSFIGINVTTVGGKHVVSKSSEM